MLDMNRRDFITLLGGAAMADKYGLLGPRVREASPLVRPSRFFELGLGRHLTADLLGDCRRDPIALLAREPALNMDIAGARSPLTSSS
jgi:hypothetical protein